MRRISHRCRKVVPRPGELGHADPKIAEHDERLCLSVRKTPYADVATALASEL